MQVSVVSCSALWVGGFTTFLVLLVDDAGFGCSCRFLVCVGLVQYTVLRFWVFS